MSLISRIFSPQDPAEPNGKGIHSSAVQPEAPEKLHDSLSVIASETFRFQKTLSTVLAKLTPEDQQKYAGQFSWYLKRVGRALEEAGYRLLDLEGETYDPGMAVTPLNLDEFDPEDSLYIEQMIEPIVMQGGAVCKTGTAILGRIEK